MDILATLRTKINSTDDGDHSSGLRAVLLHIETGFAHLRRGQDQGDETAFTDAIYRSNQAFEGSVKEAYRVLAEKDPDKKKPYDIEKYLEEKDVLRPRVLSQFTTYRTEWRNPSTHDYKLDFDESEAFVAIMNVTTFACVLIDQISERQSFNKSKAETNSQKAEIEKSVPESGGSLLEVTAALLTEFARQQITETSGESRKTEVQITGALCGFLAVAAPSIEVIADFRIDPARPERGDVMLRKGDQNVLIELKRSPKSRDVMDPGLFQLEHYLKIGGLKNGVLFLYEQGISEVQRDDYLFGESDITIVKLAPLTRKKGLPRRSNAIERTPNPSE